MKKSTVLLLASSPWLLGETIPVVSSSRVFNNGINSTPISDPAMTGWDSVGGQVIKGAPDYGSGEWGFSAAGDQIYDSQPKPLDRSSDFNRHHDYLYKWYLWVLPAHVLNRAVPTIAVPDDHDVLQGNLRGEDGASSASGDPGGYTSPASWVKMVERTQTNNLTDADPYNAAQPAATAAQGIKDVSPAWAMAASASPSSTLFFRLRQPALSTALIPNAISWQ